MVLCNNFNHWVCIARFYQNEIILYDSLPRKEIDYLLGKTVSNISDIQGDTILFKQILTTTQKEELCGYFALANATALCYGIDPGTIEFDENEIRNHLISIFFNKKAISMFPFRKKLYPSSHVYFRFIVS